MHSEMRCSVRLSAFILIATAFLSAATGFAQTTVGQTTLPTIPPDSAQKNLITQVEPEYPPLAKAAGVHGTIRLSVVIDENGDVKDVKFISGHPMLAAAAVAAVRRSKYKPFEVDGKPAAVQTEVQVSIPHKR